MSKPFQIKISKELFFETIEAIRKQDEIDKNCSKAFRTILPSDHITFYDNSILNNQLLKILKEATNDYVEHSTIEYYIYELDFGSKYEEGMIKIQEKDMPLATVEDLWNLLILENEIKNKD
jgi:hypothetical protein